MSVRPGLVRRLLFRLPLLLDRAGLRGVERLVTRLIGVEWIVLETVGRRSGRLHTVVLDVVGRDPQRDVYYVQPAYGRAAQWVRNVAAHPEIDARVGNRVFAARIRDATGAEGAEAVLRFIRVHPWYARLIVWFVGYIDRVDRPDDELRTMLADTPVFAVEVIDGSGSPRASPRAGRPSPLQGDWRGEKAQTPRGAERQRLSVNARPCRHTRCG